MIRVHRGEGPGELVEQRKRYCSRLWLAWVDRAHDEAGYKDKRSGLTEKGYRVANEELRSAFGKKCAYCECRLRIDDPADHFRPKERYPWLALSSCVRS